MNVGGTKLVTVAECPGAPTLLAFALDEDGTGADNVAAHVETCADCAGFVAGVSAFPDDVEPREGTTPASEEQVAVDRDALHLKTAGAHLTPRLLAAFCDGSLGGVSEELVMEHLTGCKTCSDAMLELTDRFNPEASWQDFLARHGAELGLVPAGEDD